MLPEHLREAKDLLYLADLDLQVAERSLLGGPPLVEPSLFHAQQATEKALKAYLAYRNQPYRRTHDLMELLDLCIAADSSFSSLVISAAALNPYGVGPRYVRLATPPRAEDAQGSLLLAREAYALY
jgi:HEPN domain-containing protein